MQTVNVVLGVLNKFCVNQIDFVRRGPKGYGLLPILRLLLYSVLAEIFSTRLLIKHLKQRPNISKRLGFKRIPSRRSLDDLIQKYNGLLDILLSMVGY